MGMLACSLMTYITIEAKHDTLHNYSCCRVCMQQGWDSPKDDYLVIIYKLETAWLKTDLRVAGSLERCSEDYCISQGTEELWPTQNLQSISGMTFNGTSFVGSIVLLAVLLAITFERVLGLDRMWANFLSDWKSKRRLEKLTDLEVNRSTLESLMSQDDDDEFDRRR